MDDSILICGKHSVVFTKQEDECFVCTNRKPAPAESSSGENDCRIALQLLLDCVDYTSGACRLNEMVGAVLPQEILFRAKKAAGRKP
jgi:hypothetical protein